MFSGCKWFSAYAHESEFHLLFNCGVLACALSVNLLHCEEW